jgi:hypothetical protein
LWRTRYDLPPDVAVELERSAANEPVNRDLTQPPAYEAQYIELLKPHIPLITVNAGPAYYVPQGTVPSGVVNITAENVSLVKAYFSWLLNTVPDYAPVVVAVEDAHAVAVCFCSRITPKVAEAGVFTEANYRGHGYATQVARGWAEAVRSTGRLPLYSTSWSNHASQAIAKKLGAVQYGVDYSLT